MIARGTERCAPRGSALVLVLAATVGDVSAGELDLAGSLEGTATGWAGDRGGGPTLRAAWYLRPALALTFTGREHYAPVDQRILSYLALGAAVRTTAGPVRLALGLGLVHQHEEPMAAIADQPLASLLGVGDGIRHRGGARAGAELMLPLWRHARGDVYGALAVDATAWANDHGPRWQASAGLGLGLTIGARR